MGKTGGSPTTRKTGAYTTDSLAENVMNNPQCMLELMQSLRDLRDERDAAQLAKQQALAKLGIRTGKTGILGEKVERIGEAPLASRSMAMCGIECVQSDWGIGARTKDILQLLGDDKKSGALTKDASAESK